MRSLKLGSMLPEKFYPIIGKITLTDIETDRVMFSGDCEIPRYDVTKQNDYIFINGKTYNFIDNNKEYSNIITIKANNIPIKFKYQINTTVEDGDFNKMCITGVCRTVITEQKDICGTMCVWLKELVGCYAVDGLNKVK